MKSYLKNSILLLTVLILSGPCLAQQYLNARQLRMLNNTDSAGINSTTGIIRYDPITGKYRFYNALTGTWFSYGTGSGGTVTASNGLTKVGDDIRWGGVINTVPTFSGAGINFGTFANPLAGPVRISAGSSIILETRSGGGDISLTSIDDLTITASDLLNINATGNININAGDLQYFSPTNQILLANSALTHTTSIFGGEIQLDFPGGSDDVTINNNQFAVTGVAEYTISANQDLTLSTISDDIRLEPASDVELAPGGVATYIYIRKKTKSIPENGS